MGKTDWWEPTRIYLFIYLYIEGEKRDIGSTITTKSFIQVKTIPIPILLFFSSPHNFLKRLFLQKFKLKKNNPSKELMN